MSFINYTKKELNCKIIFYGPAQSGKTSNLYYIHTHTSPKSQGKMISLATKSNSTLFFDFLPIFLGDMNGFKVCLHLCTVAGQSFFNSSRELVLKGVDGIVFVVDSLMENMEANIESLNNLKLNLKSQGRELNSIPFVIQYNKQDLPNSVNIEILRKSINSEGYLDFSASAINGMGVFETFQNITKLVLAECKKNI